jgi:dolichol-phosphate mannosyltransferase
MWCVTRIVERFEAIHLHETAIFYYCILALLLGSQFLLAGLLAELFVSRTRSAEQGYSISGTSGDASKEKNHEPN